MLLTSVHPKQENNKDGYEEKEMIWWLKNISNWSQERQI